MEHVKNAMNVAGEKLKKVFINKFPKFYECNLLIFLSGRKMLETI